MLLLKSPSMENRAPSIRTRIASRSKAIFWSLCQTRMIRKHKILLDDYKVRPELNKHKII